MADPGLGTQRNFSSFFRVVIKVRIIHILNTTKSTLHNNIKLITLMHSITCYTISFTLQYVLLLHSFSPARASTNH